MSAKTSDMLLPGAKVHRKRHTSKVVFPAMPVFRLISPGPAKFTDRRDLRK